MISRIRANDASDIEASADARRIQPVDSASLVTRPESVDRTYIEAEFDDLAQEQELLWRAERAAASRSAVTDRGRSRLASASVRRQVRRQREAENRARTGYVQALEHLGPFRRRPPGAKLGYQLRYWALVGGDVAGQLGAALSYGEHPATALPQAVATGAAAVTAGLVGTELRVLRDSARRAHLADDLPADLMPWAHLFRTPDPGRAVAFLAIGIAAVTALSISGGIFWLRALIDGSSAGAVYGLLAVGISLASAINCYMFGDEIADQIDAAEDAYRTELRRTQALATNPNVQQHAAARAEALSIRREYRARARAAARRVWALKWRVLGNNPGVAGHGFSAWVDGSTGRRSNGRRS